MGTGVVVVGEDGITPPVVVALEGQLLHLPLFGGSLGGNPEGVGQGARAEDPDKKVPRAAKMSR